MGLKREILLLVQDDNAKDTFCNLAEVAFDSFIEAGIAKDIPVLGTLLKTGQALLSVHDRIFLRKISSFLSGTEPLDSKTRKIFIQKLGNEKKQDEFAEQILIIIDRQDDLNKAKIIGKIFREYVNSNMEKDVFEILCHSVSSAYIGDMKSLPELIDNQELLTDDIGAALFTSNLAKIIIKVLSIDAGEIIVPQNGGSETINTGSSETTNRYVLNKYGIVLGEIIKKVKTTEWVN